MGGAVNLLHLGLTRTSLLLVRPAVEMLWSVKLKLCSLSSLNQNIYPCYVSHIMLQGRDTT